MSTELFRKEALARFMRIDAPGAIIAVAPPRTIAVFGVLAGIFIALVLLATLGHAQVVVEGRGVLRPDQPSIVLRAPFNGSVLGVRRGLHERGKKDDVLIEMDARTETAARAKCASVVETDRAELAGLEQRLTDWNQATGAGHDAALALVLLSQIRTQREKVNGELARCDAFGVTVARSRVTFPVEASVSDLAVSTGSNVHEGEILATLDAVDSRLIGYVQVPESHRSEVAVDQKVDLKFDALPFDQVGAGSAHVVRIVDALPSGAKLEGTTAGAGGVVLEIAIDAMPAGAGAPRPGMTFTADVFTRRTRVLSLLFGRAGGDD